MSSYLGRHAELYDIFYADKPYKQEAGFIAHMFQTYNATGKTLLDIACGTGTHAFIFEQMGFDVTALDYSPDMIDAARKKSDTASSNVNFIHGDMRHLMHIAQLREQQFDVVVCLFDSIGYTLANDGIAQTLDGIANLLKPNGLCCIEYWHAAAMLQHYSPVRVRRWNAADSEIIRISETSLDPQTQTAEISFDIIELFLNGTYTRLKEIQQNRFFLAQEMNAFLVNAGLTPLSHHDGFSDNQIISSNSWHIVSFSRKVPR